MVEPRIFEVSKILREMGKTLECRKTANLHWRNFHPNRYYTHPHPNHNQTPSTIDVEGTHWILFYIYKKYGFFLGTSSILIIIGGVYYLKTSFL